MACPPADDRTVEEILLRFVERFKRQSR